MIGVNDLEEHTRDRFGLAVCGLALFGERTRREDRNSALALAHVPA
jgi:hypothetical protein